MVKATGFGKAVNVPGRDKAEVCLYLLHQWEDEDGNIYARRVGTAYRKLSGNTQDWVNNYQIPVWYWRYYEEKRLSELYGIGTFG